MTTSKPTSADQHPGPGFRIRCDITRLDPSISSRFQCFDVPDISDQLNRLYALDPAITLLTKSERGLCGPVCTVNVFPGDNLMVHKALDLAKPGDIVVINGQGERTGSAVLGDIICSKARHRGIAGFVVDGLIRDLPGIDQLDIPVFARGTTAIGPLHRGPGEINQPVACGGTVVNPGDLLVGDQSGVVIVPQQNAEEILQRLEAQKERQSNYLDAVQRGEFSNEWVDSLLENLQCEIELP